ncbi:MAG: radical SAM protein [Phycisphaerales bacterium]|nr:radical SAM protein [Phycisphaerales bacterium]
MIRCDTTAAPCDPSLASIREKVEAGVRLDRADGEALFATEDIWSVCAMADLVRRRMHGDRAYYNVNRHLNYSNICALSCTFCAFHRKKGDDGAYERTTDEIREEARQAVASGATEMHIVGGLHPWLKFDYYTDMLRAIREEAPRLHLKAFTAVEIVHLARISGRGRDGIDGIRAVLSDLRDAGLGSLPGGGAEVFDDRVHDEAFKGKIRHGAWMDVHQAAHELGLHTNATMLYGHVESPAERVNHFMLLRQQQDDTLLQWANASDINTPDADRHDGSTSPAVVLTGPDEMYPQRRLPTSETCDTGWYQCAIPLPFVPDDSQLEALHGPTGIENLRTIAVARLMFDNVPHVKAFWIMQTLPMAQIMLQSAGADDIDGTVVWYDITKVEGAGTHQETSVVGLHRAIREAGLEPVERDTLYRPVTRAGETWSI